jgi:hypothetical protein
MPRVVGGQQGNEVGKRAERVAQWYFRLNGFLLIPSFVVHPDKRQAFAETDVDVLGVRFPYSTERIGDRTMDDDPHLVQLANGQQVLFVMVEVKADGGCRLNGPWKDPEKGNMHCGIRRLGFARESDIAKIADAMYQSLRWEDELHVLQYVCIGEVESPDSQRRWPSLKQITWDHISEFFFERFARFPEKLPTGESVHRQWPDFGRQFGSNFNRNKIKSVEDARKAVRHYIESGRIEIPPVP